MSHLRFIGKSEVMKVYPVFSFKTFIVLVLTFWSLIHLESVFVDGVREESSSGYVVVPTSFVALWWIFNGLYLPLFNECCWKP